jgi:4'-phosphopantetheinyl transferase
VKTLQISARVNRMNVYWLEQSGASVPPENDWLSTDEATCLGGMHIAKRRADWRLGRWTAKCAVSIYQALPPQPHVFKKIEIRPAVSGAPEVFLSNQIAALQISLSHCAGIAACAVARSGQIGCDLEIVEQRTAAFVSDYFTSEEQVLFARASDHDRPRLVTLLWSAKESALKALHEGLRLDTRCVTVNPLAASVDLNGWSPLQVRYSGGQLFYGWWQSMDNMVRTVVAAEPMQPPISLAAPAYFFDSVSPCT